MRDKIIQLSVAGVMGVVALMIVRGAWHSGQSRAKSRATLSTAGQLAQAIAYFRSDQGRYPTTLEFGSDAGLGAYVNPFPPRQFVSTECPQTLMYQNSRALSYTLSVCLPKSLGMYGAGWNTFAGSDIPAQNP